MLFAVLLRQLFNYITVSFLCQAFFKSFFTFFFQALLPLLLLRLVLIRFLLPLRFTSFCLTFSSYCLCTLSSSALLLYHLYLPLSTLSCVYFIDIYFGFFVYFCYISLGFVYFSRFYTLYNANSDFQSFIFIFCIRKIKKFVLPPFQNRKYML